MKRFKPDFLPQYQRRQIRGDEDAGKRSRISKINTSTFYTALYQSLFGGVVSSKNNHRKTFSNGESVHFYPDIVKSSSLGEVNIEIKSNSNRTGHPYVGKKQLENYFYSLVSNIHEGQTFPQVDYAFFRYGDRDTMGLHMIKNWALMKILSLKARNLLILPIPALLYMTHLPGSRKEHMDQSTSKLSDSSVAHWQIRGKDLSLAREEHLFNQGFDSSLEDLLFIDKLEVEQAVSPKDLWGIGPKGGKYKVAQFPITTYSIAESARGDWIGHLKDHHEEIAEAIGIRDLYHEEHNFFPWEKEDSASLTEEEADDLFNIQK